MNELEDNFDNLLNEALKQPVPQDLEKRLSELIDSCAARERKLKIRRISFRITAAAATVLLAIGIHIATHRQQQPADTFTNPDDAAIAVQQILAYMSTGIDRGMNQVEVVDNTFEQVNTIINNNFNH